MESGCPAALAEGYVPVTHLPRDVLRTPTQVLSAAGSNTKRYELPLMRNLWSSLRGRRARGGRHANVIVAPAARPPSGLGSTRPRRRSPLAIVIEPSRDLAQQTLDELERFAKYLPSPGLQQLLVVGGQNSREQEQALQSGVDIVVGTVGRLSGTAGPLVVLVAPCRRRPPPPKKKGRGIAEARPWSDPRRGRDSLPCDE